MSNKIFNHILSLEKNFLPATIGLQNQSNFQYRSNLTCYIDNIFYINSNWNERKKYRAENSILLQSVDNFFEDQNISEMMDSSPYPLCKFRSVNNWETQISRYGDNQHYKWHSDRIENDNRIITIVYYVHNIPIKFSGGNLSLSNGVQYNGTIVEGSKIVDIEPLHDRMVIFNSRNIHCVKPIISSSIFDGGRFSINIWAGINGNLDPNNKF